MFQIRSGFKLAMVVELDWWQRERSSRHLWNRLLTFVFAFGNHLTLKWFYVVRIDDYSRRVKLELLTRTELWFFYDELHVCSPLVSAENNTKSEMGRFLQLVLSCVVNGANKDEHIQRMMALDDALQQVLMMAIQEIMVSKTFISSLVLTDMHLLIN